MELGDIVEKIFKEEMKSDAMSSKVLSGEVKLVDVVEALGPKLTSTDVQDRMFATEILADVFEALPKDFLNNGELGFIVEFLLNRLKDQHLVVPKAILCVLPIVQCSNLPSGSGALLLNQIFTEANVQSHVHKIRKAVFLIIEFMVRDKLHELKEMSTDFVVNFLQAIDGEKDPRNLLLLFQIIPKVIDSFDLGPFIEDFYEVLACYFPIDFTPSYSVPGSELITRESLADALHVCLSQTSQFSNFLVPLALEKLDSSLEEAKVDSLRLLELCCERCYSASNLEPFLSQIWHSLRREIFMGGSETVERHSMDFLQSAFRVLSSDENVLTTCIDMVFTECKHHLCEPGLRLIQPTSRILVTMCNASNGTCKNVCPKILTIIRDQLTHHVVGNDEKKRLLVITELVLAASKQHTEVTLSNLLPDWDQIVATWFTFLTSDDKEYTTLCLKIFLILLDNDTDFPKERRMLLQEHILALVESGFSADVVAPVVNIAIKFTSTYEEEFLSASLPSLLRWIDPNATNVDERGDTSEKRTLSLTILGECAGSGSLVCEQVVRYLLNLANQNKYDQPALLCLKVIVEKVTTVDDIVNLTSSIDLLVEKLLVLDNIFQISLDLYKAQHNSDIAVTHDSDANIYDKCGEENCCRKEEVVCLKTGKTNHLNLCAKVIRSIVRCSDVERQNQIVKKFWNSNVNDTPLEQCLMPIPLTLIEALLAPLRENVEIYRRDELVTYLLELILVKNSSKGQKTWNKEENLAQKRFLAVLVNKIETENEFLRSLTAVEARICSKFESLGISFPSAGDQTMPMDIEVDKPCKIDNLLQECVELLSWITKALAMRGIRDLNSWIDKIIFLLMLESVGTIAAKEFNTLLADDPISLNPESHIKFRFLYKQRIFQSSVPKLVKGYREVESVSSKINFIQALSSQLKFIPKEILAMSIESVFPLLVASLKFDSSGPVLLSTLNAFMEMINNLDEETEKMLVEYFHDIVPELVRLAKFPGSMEVRIQSLKCLRRFAKFPIHVITPSRVTVVNDLKAALGDKKRLVRKEAYQTRNVWILVGSPGGL